MSGSINVVKQDPAGVPTPAAGRATLFVGTSGVPQIREDDGSLRTFPATVTPTVPGNAAVFSDALGDLQDAGAAPLLSGGEAGGDLVGMYPNPTIKASVVLTGIPTAPTPSPGDNSAAIATTAFVQSAAVGLWDDRGGFDASGGAFPSTGGSGAGGAVLKGDIWTVSVAGTLGSAAVQAGDTVRALVDGPGQVAADWSVLQVNLGYAPLNSAGAAGHGVLLGTGGSAVATAMPGLGGQLLIDQGAGVDPAFVSMYGDASITASGAIAVTGTNGVPLGTMAVQNTGSVAITGGAMDGVVLGAHVPAAGTFVNVNANSTITAGLSSSPGANITVNGANGSERSIRLLTGGSLRWKLLASSGSETGASAGSNFNLTAYDDGGTIIDSPLVIARASGGTISLNRPVVISGGTMDGVTIGGSTPAAGTFSALAANATLTAGTNSGTNSQIILNGAAGNNRLLRLRTAGLDRWLLFANSTAEAGSNAGSDFNLGARDDSGNAIDTPISIVRAGGGAIQLARPVIASAGGLRITGNASSAAWTSNGIALRVDSNSYTDTTSSGTVSTVNYSRITNGTIAASAATTYSTAIGTQIASVPTPGTNVSFTSAIALLLTGSAATASGSNTTCRIDPPTGNVSASNCGLTVAVVNAASTMSGSLSAPYGFRVGGATFTDSGTAVGGTLNNFALSTFNNSTLAAGNTTVTTTTAANVVINGPIVAGANQSIGTSYGLYVASVNVSSAVGTAIGLRVSAPSGAGSNYAAIFDSRVGIGFATPSAGLHLSGGTAAAGTSPLKFNSGSVLATPETGAMEYDGNQFYLTPSGATRATIGVTTAPVTVTAATATLTQNVAAVLFNTSGTCTVTLLAASSYTGRIIYMQNLAAQAVSSATANVIPAGSSTPGTAILAAAAGKWVVLISNGTNWQVLASN